MSSITICDLARSEDLDQAEMCAVRGGSFGLSELHGPFANVNVAVNQNIVQLQNIEVNALNNIGVIGASFPFHLDVSPKQRAIASVVV
jgi:hypothetical protein